MEQTASLAWLDSLVFKKTGDRLSELQYTILEQVWQGRTYLEIAERYGCTEGHAKDVGADLWKQLSQLLGEPVTKKTLRLILSRHSQSSVGQPPAPAPDFVGRTEAITHLNTLVQKGCKVIVIQGEGGIGKTTLAQHYLQSQGFEQVLALLMGKESSHITAAEGVVEEWLKRDFAEEPGLVFGISLERLKRQLRRRRVGILIDNLEPALNAQGQFHPEHRHYVELLRGLADPQSQSVVLITSRDRLCEPSVAVQHYRLPQLTVEDWQQFFAAQMTVYPLTLAAMHHAYGGNAKAMEILVGAIQTEFGGEMEPFWQHSHDALLSSTDLNNLLNEQLNRLAHHQPLAYQLFCRLGAYRYQDVPTVPITGVMALLWDCSEPERRNALVALQNRSLIEVQRGEYSLHPVLRTAAICRLQASADWQSTHIHAATFWSESVQSIQSAEDALRSLEAYYHYIAISDYGKAGRVILKSRLNQWQQHLPLGSTLYRMGLLQPLLTAIPPILQKLPTDDALCELHNILGDVYWITGHVHAAIQTQQTAIALANQALTRYPAQSEHRKQRHYYTMVGIDSRFSIGLYCLDLWDLERARDCFTAVMTQATGTDHHRWAEKAAVCLALTQSHLGLYEAAHQQADAIYQTLWGGHALDNRGSAAYFLQLLGQTYVNLGQFAIAKTLFEKALSFSTASHYTQVQGRTLTGLAIIQRQQKDWQTAISTHQAAIHLLAGLGAKCDLAEAHYQLGMTYRLSHNPTASDAALQAAMTLFEAMQMPRQAEKVQKARHLSNNQLNP
jgi:tetratricopeptide (TPR) repeat protein